jgi:hypothetical protein
MAKLITDALKELYTAQGVTATGDTIADVLKDGNAKAYSATVSGNQIADVISQTAETGTFSGGGSAPTVVTEITWDGNTEGLDSHEVNFGGGATRTYYKVSDSVLPYAVFNGADNYAYTTVNQDDETSEKTCMVFDGYVGVSDEYVVISAYLDNSESSIFGGVVVPSVGTWFAKNGTDYIKSVTVTEDPGE